MTTSDTIAALMSAAQDLAERAKSDPALVNQIMTDPGHAVAEAAGRDLPDGVLVTATTGDDGTIVFAAAQDPDFDGELDDAVLDAVAGGGACRYGKDV
jgi:NAD(P)H-hydrate repair Nnr-like enzyme with NAD(P)H-hydrate epimerase domain